MAIVKKIERERVRRERERARREIQESEEEIERKRTARLHPGAGVAAPTNGNSPAASESNLDSKSPSVSPRPSSSLIAVRSPQLKGKVQVQMARKVKVQVANQRLTPHQLAQLKQQAIQKRAAEQQKQRLAAAAANTASAGASSAATAVSGAAAVVTTAAAAGTSKLTVTSAVPGVAASIGRGQMINRQNIRNITDPEFKALLAKQVANQRLTSHQLAQHRKLHQKWAAEQQKQRLAAAANTAMVGAGSAPTVGEAALELPNKKTLQARKAEEEFKVVVDDTSKETEMKNSSLEALCSSIETKIKSGNDQLQSKIENSTSELKRKYASIETKMEKGSSNVEKRIATLESKLESKLESATESINSMIEDTSIKINNFVKPRCPICFDEMSSNTKIAQCISGHLLCWGCKEKMGDKVCAFCEQPVNGRAFGMEAYLRTIFG